MTLPNLTPFIVPQNIEYPALINPAFTDGRNPEKK